MKKIKETEGIEFWAIMWKINENIRWHKYTKEKRFMRMSEYYKTNQYIRKRFNFKLNSMVRFYL